MPRVSVVVPAFNNAAFIGQAIESVLTQSFRDLELIVADHASVDQTLEIAARYADPRLRVLTTPAGGGAPANWNRVTDAATGEYVRLLCGDDLLLPETIAHHVAALDATPSAHLAASPRRIIDARGGQVLSTRGLRRVTAVMPGAQAVRATVRAGTNIFGEPAGVTFRRSTLADVGGWDGRFPYLIDEATYVRVLLDRDFVPVQHVGSAFRMSASQWSVDLARQQATQAAAFHGWLHHERPDVVQRRDVLRGDVRALGLSVARRAAYVAFARRMREV